MDQTSPLPQTAADSVESQSAASGTRRPRWGIAAFLVLAFAVVLVSSINTPQARFFAAERFQTFVTIFLGLFIEAAPFLLAGSIVSGIIAVYVNQAMVERFIPDHPLLAALAGAGLGLVFPVCECGVVPVTRRLYGKGLPLPVGIAFLLAAPVINPVVIFSTFAAFGWGPVLWGRVAFSVVGRVCGWAGLPPCPTAGDPAAADSQLDGWRQRSRSQWRSSPRPSPCRFESAHVAGSVHGWR